MLSTLMGIFHLWCFLSRCHTEVPSPSVIALISFIPQAKLMWFESALTVSLNPGDGAGR